MGVETYFKKQLDQIVFIHLKEDFFKQKEELDFLKGIPIPVFLHLVSEESRKKEQNHAISPMAAAQAMAYVIGADESFPYRKQYMKFLSMNISEADRFMIQEGVKKAEAGDFMDAAILFRGSEQLQQWMSRNTVTQIPVANHIRELKPDTLYNYARACRDIYMESEDTDEKQTFREESVRIFEQIKREFPELIHSYYFLGYFYMNKKRYQEAEEVWTTFLERSDDEAMKDDIEERMEQLRDLMIYEKGYLEVLNDRVENGLEILLPLYSKYTEWWNLLFFIGLAYRKLNQPEEAVQFFLEVARIKPSQGDALNELGICYAALGEYENAEKYLKKAILVEENDPELWCNLSAVYLNWDKIDEAEKALIRAEEMAPGEEITKLWRAELETRKNEGLDSEKR